MDEIKQLYNLVEHCRHKRRNDVEPLLKAIRTLEIVKQGGVADDVCEWRKADEEGYQNCKCNYDETIPDFFKYCPYCGKKIKVVE